MKFFKNLKLKTNPGCPPSLSAGGARRYDRDGQVRERRQLQRGGEEPHRHHEEPDGQVLRPQVRTQYMYTDRKEMKRIRDSEILQEIVRNTTRHNSCFSDFRVVTRTIWCSFSKSFPI